MSPTWLPLGGLGGLAAHQGLPSCPFCLFFPSRVLGPGRCEQKEIARSRWKERRAKSLCQGEEAPHPHPVPESPNCRKTLSSLELKLVSLLLRPGPSPASWLTLRQPAVGLTYSPNGCSSSRLSCVHSVLGQNLPSFTHVLSSCCLPYPRSSCVCFT